MKIMDQISVKGIFTQEANKEAMEIIKSKQHILNVSGSNIRKSSNEAIQTLYSLTRFKE